MLQQFILTPFKSYCFHCRLSQYSFHSEACSCRTIVKWTGYSARGPISSQRSDIQREVRYPEPSMVLRDDVDIAAGVNINTGHPVHRRRLVSRHYRQYRSLSLTLEAANPF